MKVTFDASALPGRSRSALRMVEVFDDEMRRIAVGTEASEIAMPDPQYAEEASATRYIAMLTLDDGRKAAASFPARTSGSPTLVRFTPVQVEEQPEQAARPPAASCIEGKRGWWTLRRLMSLALPAMVVVLLVSIILAVGGGEPPTTTAARHAKPAPQPVERTLREVETDAERATTEARSGMASGDRAVEDARGRLEAEARERRSREAAQVRRSFDTLSATIDAPLHRNPDNGTLATTAVRPSSDGPTEEIDRRLEAIDERRLGAQNAPPTASPQPSPTGRPASGAPSTYGGQWSERSVQFRWNVLILIGAVTALLLALGLIARWRRSPTASRARRDDAPVGTFANTWEGAADDDLTRLGVSRPDKSSIAAPAGIAAVIGFETDPRATSLVAQATGSTLRFVRRTEPLGLSRIEVRHGVDGSGLAVMLPLAVGEGCTIEFRPRPNSPPHPHLVFDDPDIELMIQYRRSFQLEASAEVAFDLLDRSGDTVPRDRPIASALALYFLLRTNRLALDALMGRAGSLLQAHPWLPDAHVIAGEIAARRADHRKALDHLLAVHAIGPPFAVTGMTYLSDRLAMYGKHLGELDASELRQPLDSLATAAGELGRRMMAGRPITTFFIGPFSESSAAPREAA